MGAPLSPVTVPSTFPVSCCAASDDATTSSVSADGQLSARKRPKALRTRRVMEFSSRGVNARQETDERRDGTPSPPRAESGVDSGNGFSARTTARRESANGLQVSRLKAELADSRERGRKCRPVGQPARPPGDHPQEAVQPNVRKMSDEEQLGLWDAGGHLGAGRVEIDVDLAAHPEAPREIDAGLDGEPHARYKRPRVLGLEIVDVGPRAVQVAIDRVSCAVDKVLSEARDRKSTRLNSSHTVISYAVFCLKKKKQPTKRF